MPQEDADSGNEEADSDHEDTDLTRFEDFKISEEERQAAIDRVTFDRCELVREVGERYQSGDSIPVIATESGKPMMTVEEAVKTYYLVFSEPPRDGVSVREFGNGRRYFVDGDDVAALDAARGEAEQQVRAFVGRTLLENDLDAVDIEDPLPEMESLWSDELVMMDGVGIDELAEMGQTLPGFEWPSAGLSLHMVEQARKNIQGTGYLMRRGMMQDVQQVLDELRGGMMREVQRATSVSSSMLAAGSVAGMPAESAFASSAAVSSVAGASLGPGFESAVVETLNQPGFHEAVQEAPTLPVKQITDVVDPLLLNQAQRIAEELDVFHPRMPGAGATMMGAAVSGAEVGLGFDRSEPEEVFEQFGVPQSSVISEPVATSQAALPVVSQERIPTADFRWIIDQVPDVSAETVLGAVGVLAPIILEAVFIELQQMYPNQKVSLMYAQLVTTAVIELWIWNRFRQR